MYQTDRNWILNNSDNGIITSRAITEKGIHRSVLSRMVAEGDIVQLSRGIYMLEQEWEDELYVLQQKYKRGIFSNETALYLWGYSERVPIRFDMTFPTNYNAPSLKEENVTVRRVINQNFELGVTSIKTPAGNMVNVYDIERCLCDILKGSGGDIQTIQFSMKKYLQSKDRDINKLMKYAKQLRVESKVKKYTDVLL